MKPSIVLVCLILLSAGVSAISHHGRSFTVIKDAAYYEEMRTRSHDHHLPAFTAQSEGGFERVRERHARYPRLPEMATGNVSFVRIDHRAQWGRGGRWFAHDVPKQWHDCPAWTQTSSAWDGHHVGRKVTITYR